VAARGRAVAFPSSSRRARTLSPPTREPSRCDRRDDPGRNVIGCRLGHILVAAGDAGRGAAARVHRVDHGLGAATVSPTSLGVSSDATSLAPSLSPGKTWDVLFSGFAPLAGIFASFIALYTPATRSDYLQAVALGPRRRARPQAPAISRVDAQGAKWRSGTPGGFLEPRRASSTGSTRCSSPRSRVLTSSPRFRVYA